MKPFRQAKRPGGSSFSDRSERFEQPDREFGSSRPERGQMHKATCSACNAPCEVPFKPRGTKPVLCNNCFKKGDQSPSNRFGGESMRYADRDRFDRSDRQEQAPRNNDGISKQLDLINTKLDKVLKLLSEITDEE